LSILIASYYSIKRLVLENLFSLNYVTLINPNGIAILLISNNASDSLNYIINGDI
ncbi:MAG: hypothetical protein ACI846_002341, partial [Pseudoalteromonas distincta]